MVVQFYFIINHGCSILLYNLEFSFVFCLQCPYNSLRPDDKYMYQWSASLAWRPGGGGGGGGGHPFSEVGW